VSKFFDITQDSQRRWEISKGIKHDDNLYKVLVFHDKEGTIQSGNPKINVYVQKVPLIGAPAGKLLDAGLTSLYGACRQTVTGMILEI
jgi:hypothetical protein